MIALGAAVPVLAAGYWLASPGAEHVAPAADVQSAGGSAGGWGKGGYPMMTGPAPMQPAPGAGAVNAPAGTGTVRAVASQNWAGYAATGPTNSFTRVSAAWAQPAVTCGAARTFSSFWVGLDGDGTPTVEQTGTEADCANGAATYRGWYEIFPNVPVFFADPVRPGDVLSASVAVGGDGVFTLTLTDGTQGWTQTTRQAAPGARLGSAEVIAEAPSNGAVLPLADFGTVGFTGATVNGAPLGGSATLDELTLTSGAGATLASPSALTGETAFAVTFGGAAPTAPTAPTSPAAPTAPAAPAAPTAPAPATDPAAMAPAATDQAATDQAATAPASPDPAATDPVTTWPGTTWTGTTWTGDGDQG